MSDTTQGAPIETAPPTQPVDPAPPPASAPDNDGLRRQQALLRQQTQLQADRAKLTQERAEAIATLRAEDQRIKAEAASLKDVREHADKWRALQEARKNPLKALQMIDLTPEQISESVLNGPEYLIQQNEGKTKTEMDALRAEFKASEQRIADAIRRQDEQQQQYLVSEMREEVADAVRGASAEFPLTVFAKQTGMVADVIAEYYNATAPKDANGNITGPGRKLSWKNAAAEVEKVLNSDPEYADAKAFLAQRRTRHPVPAPTPVRPVPRPAQRPPPTRQDQPRELTFAQLEEQARENAIAGLDDFFEPR